MNKQILGVSCGMFFWLTGNTLANANPITDKVVQKSDSDRERVTFTPLSEQLLVLPTAQHLQRGEVSLNLTTRLFFLPDLVDVVTLDDDDTAVNFNTGFSWGITNDLQLTLQYQHVDSSSPARQGSFTSERTEDNEAAIEIKQRLWSSADNTKALSGVVSAAWGTRGFQFRRGDETIELNNRNVFVSLAVPFTTTVGDRWQFNFAPTLTFFNDENAEFFQRLPNDDDNSFGTVLGLGAGVSYRVNSRLYFWGDGLIPLTGNNSISRESGEPDKTIVYNAGLRYLVNPRLALDVFATNTFASYAPLSLTGDRDLVGIGTNLVFMPDLIAANRKYSDRFTGDIDPENKRLTTDGLAFFDGGTVASGHFVFNLQGGSQGIMTALRYGVLEDFEVGIYLDYVGGEVDESEQGISGKIRFLNQAENDPLTLSFAATVGLTNEPFVNFRANSTEEFDRRNLDKSVPIFTPGGDDTVKGELIIATFSLPLHYEIAGNTAVWFTPILSYVQRLGVELAGFNVGGSYGIGTEFSLVGEVGANFAGEGNTFIDGSLEDKIPWTAAVRWTPLSLLQREPSAINSDPYLEIYLTNRLGASTWHQLRVREDNELAVGVGLQLPF
ncbi:hypothetical protein [Myxosarcina sp. GI1]|uniref:hypothetical protein n=1 Tax=Myxosarcina sp. GI1 TaxID=1541065 RepID=UPI00055DB209|nr:hypothetical protein [Myxosarcina sp. GI1]